jgi:ribonuclease P protein component
VPRAVSAWQSAPAIATSPVVCRGLDGVASISVADTPSEQTLRYSKEFRLLKHADYDRVYKQGRRHFSPIMTFFYLERASGPEQGDADASSRFVPAHPRVGITVGRALGGAVVRNRIKRRMREAVRAELANLCADPAPEVDVVINPKKAVLTAEFPQVRSEVARGFSQLRKQLAIRAREVAQ